MVFALAFLFSATLSAQSSKPATPKKKTTASRAKGIVGKIVDSAATGAAAMATDTILGESAGAIAAVVAGGQPGAPTCPAGLVLYLPPTAAPAAGASPTMPSAGASIVGAAKSRFGKKKAKPADSTVATSQFLCGTPEQAQASMQAAQAGAQPSSIGVGSVLAATPQGMAVSGAIAAAPMVGSAAKKLGGRFRRGGQTSETMKKDLSSGKLTIKEIKFVDASDEMAPGFEAAITALAEALQAVEGQFALSVAAESDGQSPPDAALAQRRMERVAAHLRIAGVPDSRLTVRGIQPTVIDPKSAPKPGEARVEVVRVQTQHVKP
ncbi:MAG: hypothetical protein ABR543_18995 [Gemmatimonadaceae bacterium]